MTSCDKNKNTASNITNEINTRIYDRNIPSHPLQQYLDVRPVMTKYSYLPIVDPRKEVNTPFTQYPSYNVHNTFNPGNTQSPWSGFASNVNVESELKNQIFALQKCNQAVYVPSSKSDLYQFSFQTNNLVQQPHELLFQEQEFKEFNPNCYSEDVGYSMFNNSTRTQIKDLTPQHDKFATASQSSAGMPVVNNRPNSINHIQKPIQRPNQKHINQNNNTK
jgi:hypothetical protein